MRRQGEEIFEEKYIGVWGGWVMLIYTIWDKGGYGGDERTS